MNNNYVSNNGNNVQANTNNTSNNPLSSLSAKVPKTNRNC